MKLSLYRKVDPTIRLTYKSDDEGKIRSTDPANLAVRLGIVDPSCKSAIEIMIDKRFYVADMMKAG
jgi:hypothetical protein